MAFRQALEKEAMDEGQHCAPFSLPFSLSCTDWTSVPQGQMSEEQQRWGWEGEAKQAILHAALELETMRLAALEKIQRMESDLACLQDLLSATIRERDEARFLLQHSSAGTCQHAGGARYLSPEITSSSLSSEINSSGSLVVLPAPEREIDIFDLVTVKRLPEKGRLLEAVLKAGPLLQDVMLSGPLPKWQQTPPPFVSLEMPTFFVSTPGDGSMPVLEEYQMLRSRRKRSFEEDEATVSGGTAAVPEMKARRTEIPEPGRDGGVRGNPRSY